MPRPVAELQAKFDRKIHEAIARGNLSEYEAANLDRVAQGSPLSSGKIGVSFAVAELELLRAEQIARSRNDQLPPGERQIAHRALTGIQLSLERLRAWV